MGKKIITLEAGSLNSKQKRALQKSLQKVEFAEAEETSVLNDLPVLSVNSVMPKIGQWWSLPVRRPAHKATGFKIAAANPFAAAHLYENMGPVIGIEKLSGGKEFTFDPWKLYLEGLVSAPNLLIQGSLRQGKSFFIKRLVSLLTVMGRNAINTSDSKGEHGDLALALGGTVYKMGVFGSPLRLNPLEAAEKMPGEEEDFYRERVQAARTTVLEQICGLLNPSEREVTSRESSIIDWAVTEVVKDTNNNPTIGDVFSKIGEIDKYKNLDFTGDDAVDLRDGLRKLVSGNLAGMFDTHSSVKLDPDSPYTVIDTFNIHRRGNQALAVTQAVTNAWVYNTISNKQGGRRYFLIREEGWRDMKTVKSLEAHQEQLKLSGEYGISMVLIVHEDGDFDSVGPDGSKERELAKSLLRGYANKICFYQPSQTLINAVNTGSFTQAEADAIARLDRGEFLVKLRDRSYVVDGKPLTTEWERHTFDTDKQMRG